MFNCACTISSSIQIFLILVGSTIRRLKHNTSPWINWNLFGWSSATLYLLFCLYMVSIHSSNVTSDNLGSEPSSLNKSFTWLAKDICTASVAKLTISPNDISLSSPFRTHTSQSSFIAEITMSTTSELLQHNVGKLYIISPNAIWEVTGIRKLSPLCFKYFKRVIVSASMIFSFSPP